MTYFTQHLPPVSAASQGPPAPTDELNVSVDGGEARRDGGPAASREPDIFLITGVL